jgi:glycine dehydrogenase
MVNKEAIFQDRHIGPTPEHIQTMLKETGFSSLNELLDKTVPGSIHFRDKLDLPPALSETAAQAELKNLADINELKTSLIGLGYTNCHTPAVIRRNILENPAWYTAYTPYQAEIAQGRLEALLNYQTMVIDLTGMEIANASLLDEATAAAEAMTMLYASRPATKKNANKFVVSSLVHPQTIDLLVTRATPLDIQLVIDQENAINLDDNQLFGVLLQ